VYVTNTLTVPLEPGSHVDVERLRNELREAGVEEILGLLMETFITDCPQRLAALEIGAAARNIPAIRAAAHAFKSGASTIRATALAVMLSGVETSARADSIASIDTDMAGIRVECASVLSELRHVVASLPLA